MDAARSLLSEYVPEKRLPKYKGGADKDKIHKTMLDIVKVCLDPAVNLPMFYALDIRGYQNRAILDLWKAISHKRYKIDV